MTDLSILGLDVWPTEPLARLCDIVIGRTPSRSRPELWGGDQPWLSIADMNQGRRIRTTKEKITSLGVTESGSRPIPSGTVLLSFKLSIGKVAVSDIDTYTNEAIAALPILNPEKLWRDFLFWSLRSIRLDDEVDVAAKGKTLNKAKLERLEIPLPPLDEQKRIAAILDKADALRLQRQESLLLVEKFLQSVFIDMFGDPVANPKKWTEVNFGKEMEKISYGTSVKCSDVAVPGSRTILRIPNVASGEIDWGRLKFAKLSSTEWSSLMLIPGDILFVRTNGNPSMVARTAVFDFDRDAAFASYLIRVRLRADSRLKPEFINFALSMPSWRAKLLKFARTTAGNYNINTKAIKGLELIAPDMDLQVRFCQMVTDQRAFSATLHEFQIQSELLFSSIQQRAFRGELDLSRLSPDIEVEPSATASIPVPLANQSRYQRPGCFIAPPEIEAQLMEIEKELITGPGNSVIWSEDYFKYRTLSQILQPPFSFRDIWEAVKHDIEEVSYETIKDKVFEYVDAGSLNQQFDEARKEIVFHPRT